MKKYNVEATCALSKCNYIITLYLNIENDIIKDAFIKSYGCIKNNNINNFVVDLLKDKNINEIDYITNEYILNEMNYKTNCMLLIEEVLKDAIDKYHNM